MTNIHILRAAVASSEIFSSYPHRGESEPGFVIWRAAKPGKPGRGVFCIQRQALSAFDEWGYFVMEEAGPGTAKTWGLTSLPEIHRQRTFNSHDFIINLKSFLLLAQLILLPHTRGELSYYCVTKNGGWVVLENRFCFLRSRMCPR